VTRGRPARWRGVAVLLGVVALTGCTRAVDGVASAGPVGDSVDSPAELEALIVSDVASGMPRLADDELDPPAGAKQVDDIAGYSDDPVREREVLEDYGYRFGWERFWGSGGGSGPMTEVFVDQFDRRVGAAAYAADRAHNYAERFSGVLMENPPDLPGGCWLLTVEDAVPEEQLSGPTALASCGHGAFSIAVTAMADSVAAAQDEVRAVLMAQLAELPPR
jgi:hypothetical protein